MENHLGIASTSHRKRNQTMEYFSKFIATDMSLMKFPHVLLTVKMKKIVPYTRVIYSTATEVTLTSPDPAWIETEGELAGLLPARVEMQKGKIWFLN